jgi:acyl-CoA synthetase (AMP-forming)/AMP-acid ligase II
MEIESLLSGDAELPMLEYGGAVYLRGQIAEFADEICSLLDAAQVPHDAAIGVVARNRPLHQAAILGLIARGRIASMIYAFQSPKLVATDLAANRFAAVIADEMDWSAEAVEAARTCGTLGIALNSVTEAVAPLPALERFAAPDYRRHGSEIAVEILSSGTTGPPKRIAVNKAIMARALEMTTASGTVTRGDYDISPWPIGSIGGIGRLLGSVMQRRPLVYFDKFNVAEWVDAVKRHRPRIVTGMPAMMQMVLDAEVPAEDLASVEVFYGGSAPFDPGLREKLLERYGITVIWAYGATEFYGTVISWSEALHREWGAAKPGSSGRALPGVILRVVDPESGAELPPGRPGLLHARVDALGPEWIATNDLVVVDADGFMFHQGRQDGAIVRGGFKVLPETIRNALREHPAVLDAACVGRTDKRLGQVPVAVVELARGAAVPTEAELLGFLRDRLFSQAIPVQVLVADELPRTATLKVELQAVHRLIDKAGTHI